MTAMLTRLIATAMALGLVLLAALTGIGFLLAALYSWLVTLWPAWGAALAVAGACFAVAFLILLVLRLAATAPRRRPAAETTAGAGTAAGSGRATDDLAFDLGRLGAERIRANPKTSAGLALLAGLLVGVSPGLRQRLLDVLNEVRR